jgi:hypothetical protein
MLWDNGEFGSQNMNRCRLRLTLFFPSASFYSFPSKALLASKSLIRERIEPTNIAVIKIAANSFGSPSAKACQLTIERQLKAPQSIRVVNPDASNTSRRPPLSIQKPQRALMLPKVAPDIRAVFAAAGLEAYPAKPQAIKKIPKPTYQRPMLILLFSMRLRYCYAAIRQIEVIKR